MTESIETAPFSQEKIIALLRQHDVTPTAQRVEIAQLLFSRGEHLSADQVLTLVNQDAHRASKATIYNTLGLLASKGMIRELNLDPTRVFYDPNTHPHHHFYNVDTGVLTDIDASDITLGTLPRLPKDTIVDSVDVVIRVRNSDPF